MRGPVSQFTLGFQIWTDMADRWIQKMMNDDKERMYLSQLASDRGEFKIGFEEQGHPKPRIECHKALMI